MSFLTVKKELAKLDKKSLIGLFSELYRKNKSVQEYLDHFANPDEEGLFEKYKEKVVEAFYPKRGFDYNLKKGKAAISEFKKLSPPSDLMVDLMLVYVDTGVRFTNDYGDINESFYSSIESVFYAALKLAYKERLLGVFEVRAKQILNNTEDIGWGFHDMLCQYFYEFY
jgi:hypothetical protein